MAIRVGTDGLIELLPAAWSYSPATGQLAIRRFKGPHADAEAYADSLVGTGIEVMLEPIEGTPNSIVTIRDVSGSGGGGDVDANVETIWTLQPQAEEDTVFAHPRVVAEASALSDDRWTQYNLDKKAIIAGSEDGTWLTRYNDKPTIFKAMRLAVLSDEKYFVTRATLRKSRVVSPNSAITADWVGVGKIYSTTRLRQLESVPTAIVGALENGDWYKAAGTVEQMGDGRYSISTEWLFKETGGWDTTLLYVRG